MSAAPESLSCIRCGWCVPACPVDLVPDALHDAFERVASTHRNEALRRVEASVFDCIECSACTAACPSGIDLVNEFRALKTCLRSENARRRNADMAKRRFAARSRRLEKQAHEEAERRAERLRTRREW